MPIVTIERPTGRPRGSVELRDRNLLFALMVAGGMKPGRALRAAGYTRYYKPHRLLGRPHIVEAIHTLKLLGPEVRRLLSATLGQSQVPTAQNAG